MSINNAIFLFALFGPVLGGGPRIEQESLLREILFKDYNEEVRPDDVTLVAISGMDLGDLSFDDRLNIFTLYGWMTLDWNDERLAWNASEFPDVEETIPVPLAKLWIPYLTVVDTVAPEDLWIKKDIPAMVAAKGSVQLSVPMRFRVPCVADLTLWPRDVQICKVNFGSMSYNAQQVDLRLPEGTEFEMNERQSRHLSDGSTIFTSEWNLLNTAWKRNVKTYACCPESHIDVEVLFLLLRNAPSYEAVIHVPVVCISFLTVVLFLLPPTAGEKITFGGICLILNLLLTAFTFSVIGQSPSHTPLIVDLLSSQLKFLVLSVFTSAFLIRMGSEPHSSRLPAFLVKMLKGLSCILCLCSYKDEENEENFEGIFPYRETSVPTSAANTPKAVRETSSIYPHLAEKPNPSDIDLHPTHPHPHQSGCRHPISEPLPTINEDLPEYNYHPARALEEDTSEVIGSFQDIRCSRQAPSIRCKKNHPHGRDWLLLAATVDRLSLLMYLFTCSVFIARYYLAPLLKFNEILPQIN